VKGKRRRSKLPTEANDNPLYEKKRREGINGKGNSDGGGQALPTLGTRKTGQTSRKGGGTQGISPVACPFGRSARETRRRGKKGGRSWAVRLWRFQDQIKAEHLPYRDGCKKNKKPKQKDIPRKLVDPKKYPRQTLLLRKDLTEPLEKKEIRKIVASPSDWTGGTSYHLTKEPAASFKGKENLKHPSNGRRKKKKMFMRHGIAKARSATIVVTSELAFPYCVNREQKGGAHNSERETGNPQGKTHFKNNTGAKQKR